VHSAGINDQKYRYVFAIIIMYLSVHVNRSYIKSQNCFHIVCNSYMHFKKETVISIPHSVHFYVRKWRTKTF
jgi:hypothetical protein